MRHVTELETLGVGSIAIMSNDAARYPEDSFDHMKTFAANHGFRFPYVVDESQDVARAYDAVCTPDFFGFDRDLTLAYRGRLDASGRTSDPTAKRELFDAMAQVARTAMIFVRSKDGRSHTPAEFTSVEDAVAGIEVLTTALHRLAY